MNNKYILICWFTSLTLFGCNRSIYKRTNHIELTHQTLFGSLTIENQERLENSYDKIYLSPVLKYRPIIFSDNRDFFQPKITPELMLDNYPKTEFSLIIPDSLKHVYNYYDKNINMKADSVLTFFLSPLLPTKKKNTYIIQEYCYRSIRDKEITMRFMYQQFNYYEIKGKKIKKIKTIIPKEYTF